MNITFYVNNYGDASAGLPAYSDNITVMIASGDPGGEHEEFENYMRRCLSEWYDGADVSVKKD